MAIPTVGSVPAVDAVKVPRVSPSLLPRLTSVALCRWRQATHHSQRLAVQVAQEAGIGAGVRPAGEARLIAVADSRGEGLMLNVAKALLAELPNEIILLPV